MASSDLRKSILQYAMEGKLVKQDPNDEPTSVLLEKIKQEKEKLIKEGKVKRDKDDSTIFKDDDNHYYEKIGNKVSDITDEIPFEIPENWCFLRQREVCWLDNGIYERGERLPYLEAKVIRGYTEPTFKNEGVVVDNKSKVILVDGENSGEVMNVPYKGYMGSTFKLLMVSQYVLYDYLIYFFNLNKDKYRDNKRGAAIPHLNKDLFKNMLFPLPPLAEQQHIVSKLEQLEPLLDEYEKLVDENEKLDNEFPNKLKQSILQYAMEGKLVKQDPNDEPASFLLEKIKQEKEKLVKEGKAKRDKSDSTIYQGDDKKYYEKIGNKVSDITDEIPFEIPQGWNYTRIRNVSQIRNGFTPLRTEKKYWEDGTIPWFTIEDRNEQGVFISETKQHINECSCDKNRLSPPNSILVCCTASIGEVAYSNIALTTNQQFNALTIYQNSESFLEPMYLYFFCTTLKEKLMSLSTTTTFGFVSVEKLGNIIIPIPPICEQRKIIMKLEKILNIILG